MNRPARYAARTQRGHAAPICSALLLALTSGAGTRALAVTCSDYGHYLPVVGGVDLPAAPLALALQGDLVFAALGASGLWIVDVSNPAVPVVRGSIDTPGSAMDVAVAGGYAYVAAGAPGLQVVDVSNPATPALVGTADTPGTCSDLAVQGTFVYVADGPSGVWVVDVSNPLAPTRVGNVAIPGSLPPAGARDIAAHGSYAYAVSSSALHVIDVSNPGSPVIVGATGGPCSGCVGVAVQDDLVYVLGGADGRRFQVVDVELRSSPVVLSDVPLPGAAGTEVAIVPSRAFVVRGTTLMAYEIDDPASTQIAGLRDLLPVEGVVADPNDPVSMHLGGVRESAPAAGNSSIGVVSDGEFVYAGGYALGYQSRLLVIDAASPQMQPFSSFADTPGAALNVALSGQHAYVADGAAGGLQVIDVSDRASPVIVGALDTPGSASDVAVSGGLACVADGAAGMQVIDVSNPTSPQILGSLPLATDRVGMLGGFAYILNGGALHAVDLSNPAAPSLGGSIGTTLNNGGPIEISNGRAFVFGFSQSGNIVQAIDLTNPSAPQLAGSIPVGESALDLFVDGDRAYFVEIHSSFRVIDVSNPMSLRVIAGSHYNLPTLAQSVTGRGAHAFIAGVGAWGLRTLDVSAPPSLEIMGSVAIPFVNPTDMDADDAIVCVTENNVGLYVFPAQCASATNTGTLPGVYGPRLSMRPNPAPGAVMLTLELQQASDVRLQVFDIAGRRIRTLAAGSQPGGRSSIAWNGTDERGRRVANGVYIVHLETRHAAVTRRLTLLR